MLVVVFLCWVAAALQRSAPTVRSTSALNSNHLYQLTNIWTLHLRFTPDQWEAMEPKGGALPFGGSNAPAALGFGPGPGAPGSFGFGPAPGAPGFAPPDPDAFTLGAFLSPLFLGQGDTNHDGRLSRDEFAGLAEKWWKSWDSGGPGKLDTDRIRAGLNAAIGAPAVLATNGTTMLA